LAIGLARIGGSLAERALPLAQQSSRLGIEDPKGKPIEKVREIRDEIEIEVKTLLDKTD
jgi:hypothetical protein